MQWKNGFVYEGEFMKNFISGKGNCKTSSGEIYFAIDYLPLFKGFGRIFLTEGKELPGKTERFDCLCITEKWEIFEGWVKFGEKEFSAILEGDTEKCSITSDLISEGTFYHPDTSFTKAFSKFGFRYYGYGHSYLYDKETYKGMFNYGYRKGYGVCEYKDGGVYKGMWDKDERQYFGIMKYANGDTFKGMWENNEEASGEKKFENGDVYNGVLKNYQGCQGVYTYFNGDRYKGSIIGLKKNGNGVMHYADGSIYKGIWYQDLKHSNGIYTSKIGWYYQGEWNEGKMEGIGLTSEDPSIFFNFKDNESTSEFKPSGIEIYNGDYLEGTLRHGNGICIYANGDVYKGQWEQGKRHGKGEIIWANRQKYDGLWNFDEIEGEGIMIMTDGTRYYGEFSKGVFNGKGKLWTPDGNIISGDWDNGKIKENNIDYNYNDGKKYSGAMKDFIMHGYGRIGYPNGLKYYGNLKNGLYHGKGTEKFNDENYNGQWKKGLKHGNGMLEDKYGNYYEGNWDMGKKQGHFNITFLTKENLRIFFENDLPVGEGSLFLNEEKDMNNLMQSEIDNEDIILNSNSRLLNVGWDSEEIKGILKASKIRKYGKLFTEEDN
ncbi:hypothetical protein SteCoe_35483 [Stentor coeruleus]|uniref:MORN repeat protein n=1 Tax=Stentor coeruleus TaxID=5963 RepID=A0A1R2AS71_9CILI|nr:hypothetical protein SteCoe_35483 [Stentor coeruleus]